MNEIRQGLGILYQRVIVVYLVFVRIFCKSVYKYIDAIVNAPIPATLFLNVKGYNII